MAQSFVIMKKILLLFIAIATCNTAIYAKIKTIVYKSNGYTYMAVKGNFDKRILTDGDISIYAYSYDGEIIIDGKYEMGEIIGTIEHNGFVVEIQGTISNHENGSISTKSHDWKCDLRTKVIPVFDDRNCTVLVTSSLVFETSPITINIPEKSQRTFGSYLETALQHIRQEVDNRAEDKTENLYSATLTFSNGLTYEGFVEMPDNGNGVICIPRLYKSDPSQAKLTWSNGDTFEGSVYNAERNSAQIRPYSGTIKYHDGQVFEYNTSDFADFKIGNNGLCVSPSEMKESFETTIRKREEERLRKIREEEERKAAELKAKQEEEERKAAELKAKQEEEAQKIARKNELIRKYGQRYGEAIFNGEPKTGMTIEMVQDMHQNRGHVTRRISNGNEITVLSYGGDYVSFFGISGITASYTYIFVNGRLTEFSSTDAKASIDWF